MKLRSAGASETGRFRDQNEDRWGADADAGLFIVSDGIGGVPRGELAAQDAVNRLPAYVKQQRQSDESAAEDLLPAAIARLSDELAARSEKTGATIVATLITGMQCVVSHLGDSPAFLLREGQLSRLTTDHTIAQILVDAGQLTMDNIANHPGRNKLTRFLGMDSPARPDTTHIDLRTGDRLLLCSDGVSGVLDAEAIREILNAAEDVEAACAALVNAANQAGSQDNMTAMVIACDGTVQRAR